MGRVREVKIDSSGVSRSVFTAFWNLPGRGLEELQMDSLHNPLVLLGEKEKSKEKTSVVTGLS